MADTNTTSIECILANHIKFNYANIKDVGSGKVISSPTFTSGGHEWCIKYYPKGPRPNFLFHNSLVIYLELRCKLEEISAIIDFYLLDKDGKPAVNTWKTTSNKFGPDQLDCCYSHFIERTYLETKCIDMEGCFVVGCIIKVEDGLCKHVLRRREILHDFRNLLENNEIADVIFEVEGESFPAHRVVLAAQSPVFKAEFFGYMAESGSQIKHIVIKEMQSDVFKSLLHFIYTGSIPINSDKYTEAVMDQDLLAAADRYAVEGLKLMCEKKLCDAISVDNVISTLTIANRHYCTELRNACLEFIALQKNRLGLTRKARFLGGNMRLQY